MQTIFYINFLSSFETKTLLVLLNTSLTEFGIGYSPNPREFHWVFVAATPRVGAKRPLRTQCAAFETVKYFMPVSSEAHLFTQIAIGAPSDILAVDTSSAYVRNYKPCFQVCEQ